MGEMIGLGFGAFSTVSFVVLIISAFWLVPLMVVVLILSGQRGDTICWMFGWSVSRQVFNFLSNCFKSVS
jgi:hypothetical protein